ncbi:hypothetical protein [Streptomyces tsukubensis]|uniref:hypothetical protein n=1 Tax=Streptomyces tsukubensis TaxID=83656 RepID=UPI00344FDE9E
MKTYSVLCIGGPLDGRWVTTAERTFLAASPTSGVLSVLEADDHPDRHWRYRYDVESIALFGHRLHVAVVDSPLTHSADRDRLMMRAVLQRDVVEQLERP